MNDELGPAVAALQRQLDEQLQAATETKKLINMLLKKMGKPPQYAETGESSGIIRADQFYGKQFATAAAEYLELRKQATQPSDILKGLEEGGFDFDVLGWKESDRLRSLAISLAKNNVKFHRLKNGSFGLRSWYDEDFLKKSSSRRATEVEAKANKESARNEGSESVADYVPQVGDYVQWEPNGVLQFREPQRITSISPDGAFAFVNGDPTGLPIGELTAQPKPTSSAKSKSHPAADRTARKGA